MRFKPDDTELATLDAIEAGADDVETDNDELVVYTLANQLNAVQTKLTEQGYEVKSAELAFVPKVTIMIEDEKTAQQLLKLMDVLDDMDDVTATHANFDLSDRLAERLTA